MDLLQIHEVDRCVSVDQILNHTLPAMSRLKAAGKIRHVGITGYNLGLLKKIVRLAPPGTIDTVLSYCRCNILNKGK